MFAILWHIHPIKRLGRKFVLTCHFESEQKWNIVHFWNHVSWIIFRFPEIPLGGAVAATKSTFMFVSSLKWYLGLWSPRKGCSALEFRVSVIFTSQTHKSKKWMKGFLYQSFRLADHNKRNTPCFRYVQNTHTHTKRAYVWQPDDDWKIALVHPARVNEDA